MIKIKSLFSHFKESAASRITSIKNKARNGVQKFKKDFSEAKSKPISKRKSLVLGFSTVLGVFGVTLFASALPAIAKEVPKKNPKTDICTTPSQQPTLAPSEQILKGLSGVAASICALAITSGSFAIGATCGVVIVIGILKAQGK